jgi:hypothetical protein
MKEINQSKQQQIKLKYKIIRKPYDNITDINTTGINFYIIDVNIKKGIFINNLINN